MVLFVYIDETGTTSLSDEKQPILTVAAVLVREHQVQPLAENLRQLAIERIGHLVELHGQEIWGGTGPWSQFSPPDLLAVYREALGLLGEHDIWVAYASINKPKLKASYTNPYNPYLLALQFLCEKIDFSLSELKILIADERKEDELRAIEMVTDLQTLSEGIVPGRKLVSIIDTLHFVRSRISPGVQMADLVAYILQRCRRGAGAHPEAVAALEEFRDMITSATVTFRDTWPA